ncbi:PREDICTED: uncharacterized protein LOC100641882 [Amphimedon queenslandica]|uniref:TIR domain-containing protein n=1 Tax=Amphimedon queenslandica TaxID=400682 RepID=A0A1X7V981_AMPQE|nr:PREDICTED: uncharacterized protein LOC100641882 [Amphimedon queenslandica]|eukprot:XP_003385198.1 PREDICTED: uncharacterized protein LOC100641882 [Amphimedon queenslandica]
MGNGQSKRGGGDGGQAAKPKLAPQAAPEKKAPAPAPAPTPAPELQPVDVVLSGAPSDKELSNLLTDKVKAEKYSIYSNTSFAEEDTKTVARMLVDAKLLIFILSVESVTNSKCSDQVSLAYISNKPILLIARNSKEDIVKSMNFGLKLTLEQLHWMMFDSPGTPSDDLMKEFITQVQQYQAPITETVEVQVEQPLESAAPTQMRRLRMNTKFRTQTTLSELAPIEVSDTFWERSFDTSDSISWFRFQQAFINEYDAQLKNLFTEDRIKWLLDEVLHSSIFGGAEEITKDHFMQIRGDSKEKHTFWRTVRQIAVEKFNMQEVFNMQSTVRLTAVENLGKFQNPAVIEALLRLLDDDDPNIRAVAAISLGRTGIQDEMVIDRLIDQLKDGDRIVRQSACLSLGSLKAVKAIPKISDRWRNDFISVVRDAARTALEKMDVPEAQEVLKVTRVLEEEIKHLEGRIIQV